ncbi:MAG: hypothetical protein JWO41_604 [Candidatus Saccharibacteria bacterium]|nr:hypothetical protein [Candidatus Saccharibacteria bacterium]
MTAPNHALTGAIIGLTVSNPILAIIVAVASHFVCDAIPHFDVPGKTAEDRMRSNFFLRFQIIFGGLLCLLIVLWLALARPHHWQLAVICAFAATIPDLLYVPRYLHVKRNGRDNMNRWWFWRLHNNIQWFQRPIGALVEIVWAGGTVIILSALTRGQ